MSLMRRGECRGIDVFRRWRADHVLRPGNCRGNAASSPCGLSVQFAQSEALVVADGQKHGDLLDLNVGLQAIIYEI
jgi:hypothetical protein